MNEMMAAGDLYIGINIDPTRIGDNMFMVTVRDGSGDPFHVPVVE